MKTVLPLKDALIAKLPPAPAGVIFVSYSHPDLQGLALRVFPNGSKTWNVSYSVRVGGERKIRRVTLPHRFPALDLKGAERAAKVIVADVAIGRDPAAETIKGRRAVKAKKQGLFGVICADFIREAIPKMRPTTRAGWEPMVREIAEKWGACSPDADDMGREILKPWFAELMKERSGFVANRRFQTMRRIFSWAIEEDRIEWTPFVKLEKPYDEKPRLRVYSIAEIKAIWAAIGKEPLARQTFWRLCFWTLARRDEVRTMRWPGIDWTESTWSFMGKGKGDGKAHTLPLVRQAVKRLSAAHEFTGDSEYVLACDDMSKPMGGVQKSVYRIRKRSGVKDFRAHDLRKTGSNRLVVNGFADIELVKKILNHGGQTVTDVYTQYGFVPEMRVALQKYADWLDAVVAGKVTEAARPIAGAA